MTNQFDHLYPEKPAVIPPSAKGVMDLRTTKERRADELEKVRGAFDRLCTLLFEGEVKVS